MYLDLFFHQRNATISKTTLTTFEYGRSDNFTIKLSSKPRWGETVKIEIISSDNGTENTPPERPFWYGQPKL